MPAFASMTVRESTELFCEFRRHHTSLGTFMNSGWDNTALFLVPASSFLLTILFVPLIARLATRCGYVALRKEDGCPAGLTLTLAGSRFFLAFWLPSCFPPRNFSSPFPF